MPTEVVLPEPDENAPIGSSAHRMWFISVRHVCAELVHQCHMTPPHPCVPCLRVKGHEGGHAMWWNYDDEYPGQPRYDPAFTHKAG